MSAPHMDPIKDKDGRLRPEWDRRDVPVCVMAVYLGVSASTVSLRAKRGEIPYVKHGSMKAYQPWRIWAELNEPAQAN